jgi:hypothetical protein
MGLKSMEIKNTEPGSGFKLTQSHGFISYRKVSSGLRLQCSSGCKSQTKKGVGSGKCSGVVAQILQFVILSHIMEKEFRPLRKGTQKRLQKGLGLIRTSFQQLSED